MRRISVAFGLVVWLAGIARAHLDVVAPMERGNNATNQKIGPCGGTNAGISTVRNPANVQTFQPGQTIMIQIQETINHTGYYRVSFDDDGQDIFKFPTAPGTAGHVIPAGQDGVLVPEVMDVMGQSSYTIPVTLPNIECTNCTLQVAQIMTEKFANGAPWNEAGGNSIYYRCIDVTLSNSAPPSDLSGATVSDMASASPGDMGRASDLASPPGSGTQPGACQFATKSEFSAWLLLLASATLLFRRRRAGAAARSVRGALRGTAGTG